MDQAHTILGLIYVGGLCAALAVMQVRRFPKPRYRALAALTWPVWVLAALFFVYVVGVLLICAANED